MIKKLDPDEFVKTYVDRFEHPLRLVKVDNFNHQPHPYMIGPMHLKYSPGIYLDIEHAETQGARCYWRGETGHRGVHCNKTLDEHTYKTAVFLELQRDCTTVEISMQLRAVKEEMEALGVDGFAFIENGFKIKEVQSVESTD
jgi:hypothetical protein